MIMWLYQLIIEMLGSQVGYVLTVGTKYLSNSTAMRGLGNPVGQMLIFVLYFLGVIKAAYVRQQRMDRVRAKFRAQCPDARLRTSGSFKVSKNGHYINHKHAEGCRAA